MVSTDSLPISGCELIRELGDSGMAKVYLATQTALERKVVLKIMRRDIADAEKFEKYFLMEARILAKLPHRNIVSIYEIVKNEQATYIAMEYLEGGTLVERMRSGLSLAEALVIVMQSAGALQFAQDHGIVHQGLKPANIIFRDATTPVLTDFGSARGRAMQFPRPASADGLGEVPTYSSPEQIKALELDGRSDVYSLGILFYELLTGNPPFQSDSPAAILLAHLNAPPPLLPSIYKEFQPILDRMLMKNRDQRYSSVREFTKALKTTVIDNEMLWSRLQADPNQSSSEQLRALGFSVSSTNTEDGLQRALQRHPQASRLPLTPPGLSPLSDNTPRLGQATSPWSEKWDTRSRKRLLISLLAGLVLLALVSGLGILGYP